MVSKLQNRGGVRRRVWAVKDPLAVATSEPNKKKGGRVGLVPAKRKLVKTMAFFSIVEFVGSIFCGSGAIITNSANSTAKIPSAMNSKQTVPEQDGLTFAQKA